MPTTPSSPDNEPESPGPVPPQREIPVQPPAHDPVPPAPRA